MPTVASLHIDTYLTNMSVMYTNPAYYADQVFVPRPVTKRTDKYVVYPRSTATRSSGVDASGNLTSLRRPGAEATEMTYGLSNASYAAEEYAKRELVTYAAMALADEPIDIMLETNMILTASMLLDNETAVANKVLKRGNYASGNQVLLTTGSSGTSWASGASANSLPLQGDLVTGKKQVLSSCLHTANSMVVNYNTAVTLSQHPQYIDKIKYTSREGLTAAGLVPNIEGLNVVETSAIQTTSAEGVATASETSGQVWVDDSGTDCCLVCFINPVMGLRQVTLGVTFDAPDDLTKQRGIVVRRWDEPKRKGQFIEVSFMRDWRFIATDGSTNGDQAAGYASAGYLISGCTL